MMGWSRRPNSPDTEPDPHGGDPRNTDPLADNMRLNRRRPAGGTAPLDDQQPGSIYDQHTVVDTNFSNRSQTRRQRQTASPFSTQQLSAWAAEPDNTRKLLMIGGAVLIFLLLLALISFYNRQTTTAANDVGGALASEPAGATAPELNVGEPAASVDPGLGTVPQPVETVPNSDPAQQPAAGGTGQFFVVTGTGSEGLFLRPDPSTNGTPVTTLPEGTRVEATGETNNDGTREWRKVRSELGEGWVAADFLQPTQ